MRFRSVCLLMLFASLARAAAPFRPPAVPLVTHDPYLSIWSMSDRLTDEWPKHWTGVPHALCGMIRIDNKTYRFLGPNPDGTGDVPALKQTALQIWPTRTIAMFRNDDDIRLTVTFCSPLLPNNLDILARPVTYVTCEVRSTHRRPHQIALYLDMCSEVAVHTPDQVVRCTVVPDNKQVNLFAGTLDQAALKRSGDGMRIDWGYAALSVHRDAVPMMQVGLAADVRKEFVETGKLAGGTLDPRPVKEGWPVVAIAMELPPQELREQLSISRHMMVAYDEDSAVEYFGKTLPPYWRKNVPRIGAMLTVAEMSYTRVSDACREFDQQLMTDLKSAGGEQYAELGALAYRQAFAGHGLALGPGGRPFMFAKENSSNGCIGTVDVIYPTAPIFLLLSPPLMEANLAPVIEYADSQRWKFPFAPHDLGTYPLANGQVYGGGEKTEKDQMPVEETANMLLLVATLEKATDSPSGLARDHRELLRKWADYLIDKGLDPENQLCTDDFTGHLAHNVNLSAKAILGIAAYGQICQNHEQREEGARYLDKAKEMAKKWVEMAGDGDHTKLAFDKPDTWSQKYNLVWDKVLGLKIFPPEVAQREVAFYKSKQNKFGLPLDNRATFTKLDWTVWSACLADKSDDFETMIAPIYAFMNETPDRVPLTDWYQTDTAKNKSFKARPVVGGVFMKMLCEPKLWQKWARAGQSGIKE